MTKIEKLYELLNTDDNYLQLKDNSTIEDLGMTWSNNFNSAFKIFEDSSGDIKLYLKITGAGEDWGLYCSDGTYSWNYDYGEGQKYSCGPKEYAQNHFFEDINGHCNWLKDYVVVNTEDVGGSDEWDVEEGVTVYDPIPITATVPLLTAMRTYSHDDEDIFAERFDNLMEELLIPMQKEIMKIIEEN